MKKCGKMRGIFLFLSLLFINTSKSVIGTNNKNSSQYFYSCPSACDCSYEPISLHLSINSKNDIISDNGALKRPINISNGVRKLTLSQLGSSFSFSSLPNSSSLIELHVNNSILDSSLADSPLLTNSQHSLRKIKITDSSFASSSIFLSLSLTALDTFSIVNGTENLGSGFGLNAPSLKILVVKNSYLFQIPPSLFDGDKYGVLEELNLGGNKIGSIPWGLEMSELKSLDLSKNAISHLQEDVFKGLSSLLKLNLSSNRINYIDSEVFLPLSSLSSLDLSHNSLHQFFEPYFKFNLQLKTLLLRHTWANGIFRNPLTRERSEMEMDLLLDSLISLEVLDMRDNDMGSLPESLTHLPSLRKIELGGNSWTCSCRERWAEEWANSTDLSIGSNNEKEELSSSQTLCSVPSWLTLFTSCNETTIMARTPKKYYGILGTRLELECHAQRSPTPKISWTIPSSKTLQSLLPPPPPPPLILSNGNLVVQNVSYSDLGLYICTASYTSLNITHFIHVGMDTTVFDRVKIVSLGIGAISSLSFLSLVLLTQLIRKILNRHGIECPSITAPYKSRNIKRFFEGMEQHKNTQLVWLRENYNMQAKRIKENCISQIERLRESYTNQAKNLSDIRDYGAQQCHTMRDQYHDQVRRVSSYSAQQLCRVRENYVFQRNRVGKFSSHQLLRLRETYKWQAQAVNKILENLPKTLNFDTCRGVGVCGRADSIYLQDISQFENLAQQQLHYNVLGSGDENLILTISLGTGEDDESDGTNYMNKTNGGEKLCMNESLGNISNSSEKYYSSHASLNDSQTDIEKA